MKGLLFKGLGFRVLGLGHVRQIHLLVTTPQRLLISSGKLVKDGRRPILY